MLFRPERMASRRSAGLKISRAFSTATNSTLSLPNVVAAEAGSYTVTVSNGSGTVTSDAATLTVNTPTPSPPNNGGGGGGAPSAWFCGGLALLVSSRLASRRSKNSPRCSRPR